MKISTSRLNLLIGLNCFILFFLLFEHLVRIPAWVQPVGRMHPMILHFHIVLAGVLINFRKKLEGAFPVARLIQESLFIAAFTAAVTVIMGLFLAKEDGYEGSSFLWHKWTGVAICFLSLVLVLMQGLQLSRYRFLFTGFTNLCLLLVYAPESIEIWGGADSANARLLTRLSPSLDKLENLARRRLIYCPVKAANLGYLKVTAQLYLKIPGGFPALAGAPGCMLMKLF